MCMYVLSLIVRLFEQENYLHGVDFGVLGCALVRGVREGWDGNMTVIVQKREGGVVSVVRYVEQGEL